MATLYVAEFAGVAETGQGDSIDQVAVPPIAEQTVAIAAGSTAVANAFNAATTIVEVSTDSICSIAWGTAPVATASMCRLAAGERIRRRVPAGQSYKVAVITNT